MLGADPTMVWASMASWFTPTVLFCILNLMIATIFIASSLKPHNRQQHTEENPPGQLVRGPSLLERVKSINFSLYYTPEHHYPSLSPDQTQHTLNQAHHEEPTISNSPGQLVRTPSLLERVRSFNFSFPPYKPDQPDPFTPQTQTEQTDPQQEHLGSDHHVTRTQSDTCGVTAVKVSAKMKKSASEKGVAGLAATEEEEEEDVDRRRPATMTERKGRGRETAWFGEDEGVDAKADDFINRFKQQLKLQRLDSLLRYKEMLGRGSAK